VAVSALIAVEGGSGFVFSISPQGAIEAPLVLSFFVVSGLRAVFNMPYELGANWMFQITTGADTSEFLAATRRWVLLRGVMPVYAVLGPLQLLFFQPAEAVFHLSFGLAVAVVLTEFFFFQFNKVPFTCSYLPAKSHLAFLAAAYLYGFTIYTFTISRLDRYVGERPERMVGFFAAILGLWIGLALYRRKNQARMTGIVYEDNGDPLVQQLEL
jgi:hypothetical protein